MFNFFILVSIPRLIYVLSSLIKIYVSKDTTKIQTNINFKL